MSYDLAFILQAKIYHLARFMMAENPERAELYMSILSKTGLSEIMSKDKGALHYVINGKSTNDYIIWRKGSHYTDSKLPDWIEEKNIVTIEITPSKFILLNLLKETCKELKVECFEAYEQFRTDKMLKSISGYYESELPEEVLKEIRVIIKLSEMSIERSSTTLTEQVILNWSQICLSKLTKEYLCFTIASDTLLQVLATLFLFHFSPISAEELFLFGKDPFDNTLADHLENDLGLNSCQMLPMLNFKQYLHYLNFLKKGSGLDTAIKIVRHLQKIADALREKAQEQISIEMFYRMLYEALLYYRCSLFIYDVMLLLEQEQPSSNLEDIRHGQYICEEMRVIIISSLQPFYRCGVPQFTSTQDFWAWLYGTYTKDNITYPPASKQQIHNWYSLLKYPKILRDLALGYLLLDSQATINRGKQQLLQIANLLEANLQNSALIGEPNYLLGIYEVLAKRMEQVGQLEEARIYAEKATPEYITLMMSQVFR